MKKLYIVSDKYLKALTNKATDVFEVGGCRNFKRAVSDLKTYQYNELVGALVVLSSKYDDSKIDEIDGFLYAWSFYEGKIVVYCQSSDTMDLIEEKLSEFENIQAVLIESVKDFTEEFIGESLLGCFASDDIYKEDVEIDKTGIIEERVKDVKTTEENEEEGLIETLRKLVKDTSTLDVEVDGSIGDLVNNPENFSRQDNVFRNIKENIETIKDSMETKSKDSEEYKNLDLQVNMLEMVAYSRENKIKDKVVNKYLEDVKNQAVVQVQKMDLDKIENTSDDIMSLKKKQMEYEEEIRELFKESQETVRRFNETLDIKDIKQKILLLQENKGNKEYKEVIPEVLALGKESLLSYKAITNCVQEIVKSWGSSLEQIKSKFKNYSEVRDKIDVKHEELIEDLLKSKSININVTNSLAQKMVVVTGLADYVGASLVGIGIHSNSLKGLFVDLRFDNCRSEMYFKNEMYYNLENAIDGTIEDLENSLVNQGHKVVLPGMCGIVLTDRVKFTKKVLTALERVSKEYDKIVVVVNPMSEEGQEVLRNSVLNVMVSGTNLYRYRESKKVVDKLNEFNNIKFKYLVLTPASDEVDGFSEAVRLGIDGSMLRIRKIPYMSVDMYKNVGQSIFTERPAVLKFFEI